MKKDMYARMCVRSVRKVMSAMSADLTSRRRQTWAKRQPPSRLLNRYAVRLVINYDYSLTKQKFWTVSTLQQRLHASEKHRSMG